MKCIIRTQPPIRTDNGEQTIAELPQVYSAEPENYHSRDEMKEILIDQFGVECWGCADLNLPIVMNVTYTLIILTPKAVEVQTILIIVLYSASRVTPQKI